MTSIYRNLARGLKGKSTKYSTEYMDSIQYIYKDISKSHLLKSKIDTGEVEAADRFLRFSLVFNDLTLFRYPKGDEMEVIVLTNHWFKEKMGKDAYFRTNIEQLERLGLDQDKPKISPAFIFPTGDAFNKYADQLSSFTETGKLLFHPTRCMLSQSNENILETVAVNEFTPLDSWEIIDESRSRPIEITAEKPILEENELFEVVIPYLENVPYKDLSKILDDESDLVSQLRLSIKQAISECQNSNDYQSIRRDLVDPKVDAVNRKFRAIVNNSAYKVAAAGVGTAVLAYTSVSTVGISSALTTIVGSGGLGLLAKEYSEYREELNQLKSDPHYLLWRCKKLQQSA